MRGNEICNPIFILTIIGIGLIGFSINFASAETQGWYSDFKAGILPVDLSEFNIDLQIQTYTKDALKLQWSEPELAENQIVSGYNLMRKTLKTEYVTIATNVTNTNYIDSELSKGFYGYKIIPIIEMKKPEPVSMHGIDRKHSLFDAYLQGQELLAQYELDSILNGKLKYYDSLEEPKTIYRKFLKRSEDSELQKAIKLELERAEKIFRNLFNIEINH